MIISLIKGLNVMKIRYVKTPFVEPISGKVYKVSYYIGRFSGEMKNGKEIAINVYEPIIVTKKENENKTKKEIRKMVSERTKKAKESFRKRVEKITSGKKRIGLKYHKGYFYFLNAKEVT